MTDKSRQWIRPIWLAGLLFAVFGAACSDTPAEPAPEANDAPQKLLIIGQDLGAIRGYMASDCCPQPDGLTAYLDFYDLLKDGDFGGLGIGADGNPLDFEFSWGAGPVGAWETATEFGVDGLAIGLSLTENEHPGKLKRIADGDFDAEIAQLAVFAKKIPGPIYLRIGYEFDGAWNQGYGNTENYISAWRHIVTKLRDAEVDNVEMVWQGAASVADEIIDQGRNDISLWYPGDEYVDWVGFSWFMTPNETMTVDGPYNPRTPLELTNEILEFAREHGKPVMIAEASPQALDLNENFMAHHSFIWDGDSGTGRVDMTDDEIWDHWFAPLFQLLADNNDVIHALAYINADWDSQPMWGPPYASGFWGDTRLEVNEAIAARFSEEIEKWKTTE